MSRVIINNNFNSVRVNSDNPNIIEVATPGPKGDKGDPGFPFTGSAEISGSLDIIGGLSIDGFSNVSSSIAALSSSIDTSVAGTLNLMTWRFRSTGGTVFPNTTSDPQTYAIGGSVVGSVNWVNCTTQSIGTSTNSTATIPAENSGNSPLLAELIPLNNDIEVGSTLKLSIISQVSRDSQPNTLQFNASIMKINSSDIFSSGDNSTLTMLESISNVNPTNTSNNEVYWSFSLSHTVGTKIDKRDGLLIGFAVNNLNNSSTDSLGCNWRLDLIT